MGQTERRSGVSVSTHISRDGARRWLVGHLGLRGFSGRRGARGTRELLAQLRCIQLDPLDVIGTNADLVALARVDGIRRGDVYRHLLPAHAFEHFAKERCLLPASAFPYYRDQAAETPWWRLSERKRKLAPAVLDAVLAEVRRRGPVAAADLTDHGRVEPIDWSGWKGTAKASSMALEVLWTQCRIVVCGRTATGKVYDVPSRALPDVHRKKSRGFARWALLERVEAAGLLARAGGPCWSMLNGVRTTGLVDELIEEGRIEEVTIEGSTRPFLAPAGFRYRRFGRDDGRMRILGPLDPVLWDRTLVKQAFGFDYVWEVYKPKSQRRWGWYVCPLLHRGRLVGRIEARLDGRTLVVDRLWKEDGAELEPRALDRALARHAEACGADSVRRME
jgi:hypothetical protein